MDETNTSSIVVSVSDFEIGDLIGRGRFGHVFKVTKKDSSKIYAMKVLFKEELVENKVLGQVVKEIDVQSRLKHKYILRLKFVSQDSKRVYLFMNLADNGNLYSYLGRLQRFPELIAGKYLRQLMNAVTYLHQNKIMHRDIKPENLMLSANGDLLLGDFGWCSVINDQSRWTICGTLDYLPPEMVMHQEHSETVDSWTCGVLCFEFLTGVVPFVGENSKEKFENIIAAKYTCPDFMSKGAKSFIACALRADAEKRYSAGELFLHPWIQSQDESGPSIMDYEKDPSIVDQILRERELAAEQAVAAAAAAASAASAAVAVSETLEVPLKVTKNTKVSLTTKTTKSHNSKQSDSNSSVKSSIPKKRPLSSESLKKSTNNNENIVNNNSNNNINQNEKCVRKAPRLNCSANRLRQTTSRQLTSSSTTSKK